MLLRNKIRIKYLSLLSRKIKTRYYWLTFIQNKLIWFPCLIMTETFPEHQFFESYKSGWTWFIWRLTAYLDVKCLIAGVTYQLYLTLLLFSLPNLVLVHPSTSFPALIFIPIVITQDLRHVKVCIGVVEENVKSYLRPLLLDVLNEDGNFHGSSHLLSKNIFWNYWHQLPSNKMKKFKKVLLRSPRVYKEETDFDFLFY